MFLEFKPKDTPPSSRETISNLFQKADFHNAPTMCKKSGYTLSEFQKDIEIGSHKAIMSHRVGELLSFLYNHEIKIQHDTPMLLKILFDTGAYHDFLKNAHRFKIYKGFENEIDVAISNLIIKGQKPDAEGWRRKLEAIRNTTN